MLTVIILSKGRQKYLLRQIEYWSLFKKYKVLIFDQSEDKLDIVLHEEHIRYFHTNMDFQSRVVFASDFISTKYVIFLPDDEFLLPHGLDECITFLEENAHYSSCLGKSLSFNYESERVFYRSIYEETNNLNIRFDNSLDRISKLSNPYCLQPIHSVSKAVIWKRVAEIFKNCQSLPPESFELFYGFTAAYYGNIMVLPSLMNLRSGENKPINDFSWNQEYRIEELIFNNVKLNDLRLLFLSFSKNLEVIFSLEIMHGIYSYIHFINRTNNNSFLIKKIKYFFLSKMVVRNNNYSLDELIAFLNNNNVKYDFNQLVFIQNLVLKTHLC